ncbi:hypothetical protein Drorol1_Dr00013515 [Drosera rotundifolia]
MFALAFLPARSLMRFKCVSKRWCSLINNPYFSYLHNQNLAERAEPTERAQVRGEVTGKAVVRMKETGRDKVKVEVFGRGEVRVKVSGRAVVRLEMIGTLAEV